jgi:hypothetical protein
MSIRGFASLIAVSPNILCDASPPGQLVTLWQVRLAGNPGTAEATARQPALFGASFSLGSRRGCPNASRETQNTFERRLQPVGVRGHYWTGSGRYRGTREDLVPLLTDPWCAVPFAVVVTRLLRAPDAAERFSQTTGAAYSLTRQAIGRLRA